MSESVQYVRTYVRDLADCWDRFWFAPTDPITLGVIRILAGAMLFYTHLVWTLDFDAFFGEYPWISIEAVDSREDLAYAWSHFYWIDSIAVLRAIHFLGLIVFALLTVGLWSRVVSVLAFLLAVSYANRLPGALFGLDQINTMLAMYLMIGPSGAALSVDRLRQRRRGRVERHRIVRSSSANVAIRLMQLHLCIIYLFSGLGKLLGISWWTGMALWGAVANLEYQSVDATWLAHYPLVINLMTQVTVAWELFYIALVWPRLTRPMMLLMAIPLHLGIAIFLGMITFGLIMLVANMAFLPPEFFRWIGRAWSKRGRGGAPPQSPAPAAARPSKGRRR